MHCNAKHQLGQTAKHVYGNMVPQTYRYTYIVKNDSVWNVCVCVCMCYVMVA